MSHTPGPWKVEYDEKQKMSFVYIPKRVNDVGLDTTCTLGMQKHADAELIARAPIMQEELERYKGEKAHQRSRAERAESVLREIREYVNGQHRNNENASMVISVMINEFFSTKEKA